MYSMKIITILFLFFISMQICSAQNIFKKYYSTAKNTTIEKTLYDNGSYLIKSVAISCVVPKNKKSITEIYGEYVIQNDTIFFEHKRTMHKGYEAEKLSVYPEYLKTFELFSMYKKAKIYQFDSTTCLLMIDSNNVTKNYSDHFIGTASELKLYREASLPMIFEREKIGKNIVLKREELILIPDVIRKYIEMEPIDVKVINSFTEKMNYNEYLYFEINKGVKDGLLGGMLMAPKDEEGHTCRIFISEISDKKSRGVFQKYYCKKDNCESIKGFTTN